MTTPLRNQDASGPRNGILVISIGFDRRQWLWNCITSIKRHAPDVGLHVVSDVPVDVPFTWVASRTDHASRYYKTQAYRLSPFEGVTLFVDDDTVLHRRLPAFDEILGDAELAMALEKNSTIGLECQTPNNGWALDAERAATIRECNASTPYYNSGIMFWKKTARVAEAFDCWHREWMRFQHVDQFALSRALARCNMRPRVLDAADYNCRTDWFDKEKSNPCIFHFSQKHHENWYHSTHASPAEAHASYRAFSHAADNGICRREQYAAIGNLVLARRPCRLLVFGCGADSELWRLLNIGGITWFVEHDPKWASRAREVGCDVIEVEYPTGRAVSVDMPPPPAIMEQQWDTVIIDAPQGFDHNTPGREIPIQWIASLDSQPIVILHDYERPWERACADAYLGPPSFISQLSAPGQMAFWRLSSDDIAAMLR